MPSHLKLLHTSQLLGKFALNEIGYCILTKIQKNFLPKRIVTMKNCGSFDNLLIIQNYKHFDVSHHNKAQTAL